MAGLAAVGHAEAVAADTAGEVVGLVGPFRWGMVGSPTSLCQQRLRASCVPCSSRAYYVTAAPRSAECRHATPSAPGPGPSIYLRGVVRGLPLLGAAVHVASQLQRSFATVPVADQRPSIEPLLRVRYRPPHSLPPRERSNAATAVLPLRVAMCNGVARSEARAFTRAPWSSSAATVSVWPRRAAKWSAVMPLLSRALMSAPRSSSNTVFSVSPCRQQSATASRRHRPAR